MLEKIEDVFNVSVVPQLSPPLISLLICFVFNQLQALQAVLLEFLLLLPQSRFDFSHQIFAFQ